jgi:diguanylate cyclase (GGDEF)-like protein
VWRRVIPLAVALLALAGVTLCAQEPSFRDFGSSEGLKNLAVRKIYQDHTGFLWVSTENGIFRFDGERFEPFGAERGIPSNSGVAFGEAPDGSLLVGGAIGLYRLSGNRFEKLTTPFKIVAWAQGIQSDGRGHTFLGTDAGLVELDSAPGQTQFAMHTSPQPAGTSGPDAFGILVDGDALWYGCGHELCRKDARGTKVFSRDSGLPDGEIQVIVKDHDGNLWVRVRNAGVFEWLAGKGKFSRPHLPISPESVVGVPAVDREGRILLPSPQGLFIGDRSGWRKIDRSDGLRGTIYSVFEDRQHSLWVGLAGRGLFQWRGYREWETYSSGSGLTNDLVYEILPRDDGSIFVASEGGLFRGERKQFGLSFKPVAGMNNLPVHSVHASPNGDLWLGTETRGVARFNPRTQKVEWFGVGQGLTGMAAYALCFDREQKLWVASENGLFVAQPPYREFSRVAELPSARFWAVVQGSDGTLWAGGTGGLFALKDGTWRNFTQRSGLSNQEVLSLGAGPNGVIWVGYRFGGGIDRVRLISGRIAIDKGIQRPGSDGLIYFLDFDTKGHLWAGTEHGVDMWDGVHWTHYDMNDGLAWDDCNLNAFAAEPDGTVWIGTSGGLSRFKPLPRPESDAPLAVVLTRLTVGENDVSGLANPAFGIRSKPLVARYSALNASRQNEVVFRYRLGVESQGWTETDQRELQFAGLAPGPYRLEVQARENDGEWSGSTAGFPFRILTPWYASWWFILICALIPLSATGAMLRLRLIGAQKREQELVNLVEEKTADLRLANAELKKMSFTDPLTGLVNRRIFDRTMERECSRVRRTGSPLSLIMIDVDHFKALNDSLGHPKGDKYLILLSAELKRRCRRRMDTAARYGGEEFAIILPDTDAAHAIEFAELVRQAVSALDLPHPASPTAPFLTVSVGIATSTGSDCFTAEDLVAGADRALYAAKDAGRNRVCVAQHAHELRSQISELSRK